MISIFLFFVLSTVSSFHHDVVCLIWLAICDIVSICQFPGQTDLVTKQTSLGQWQFAMSLKWAGTADPWTDSVVWRDWVSRLACKLQEKEKTPLSTSCWLWLTSCLVVRLRPHHLMPPGRVRRHVFGWYQPLPFPKHFQWADFPRRTRE